MTTVERPSPTTARVAVPDAVVAPRPAPVAALGLPVPGEPGRLSWPLPQPVTFPPRFAGPAGMANGGWVAGTLAGHLPGGPVSVTLRAPAPLDRPLALGWDGTFLRLQDDDVLVATAERKGAVWSPPSRIEASDARRAEAHFAGLHEHPFPGCFVCGTERGDDALRLRPGPVAGRPNTAACTWTPAADLADEQGRVDPRTVWAALDCPTGWAHFRPGGVAVLGRLTGQVLQCPEVGEPCVVVARRAIRDGRKLWATSAVYRADGSLAGAAAATWIDLQGRRPGGSG